MTLIQLFTFLNQNTPHSFFQSETELSAAIAGEHTNPLMGDMIRLIAERCHCSDINCEIKREDAVNALGPLRLQYMKDDAPVDGFRLLEGSITAIDLAFNDEVIKARK